MRIAIVKNAKELGERAFVEIKKVISKKPDAVIGFATGATPVALYEKMADDHKHGGLSYKQVKAFNLDEYVGVDPNGKASFKRFMADTLFSKIDIDPANTDIPNGMAQDLEAECARYSAAIKENPADLQILGIGENGHIAFNEPYTKPDEPTHIALLTASTRAANASAFKDPSLVPQYALTMGINEILTAKRILLLALGERKAQAIYDMIMGRDDTSCPATALRKHPDVTVVLDREAASLLTIKEWEKGSAQAEESAEASVAEQTEEAVQEPVAEQTEEAVQEPVAEQTEEAVQTPVAEQTEEAEQTPVAEQTEEAEQTPVAEQTAETVQTEEQPEVREEAAESAPEVAAESEEQVEESSAPVEEEVAESGPPTDEVPTYPEEQEEVAATYEDAGEEAEVEDLTMQEEPAQKNRGKKKKKHRR